MHKTIPEIFFEVAEKQGGKTALLYKKEGVYFPITYKELSEKVKIFAKNLQDLGIEKNDKIALLSENSPSWAVADLAAQTIGAVLVPLHTTLNTEALLEILKHSESKILFISEKFKEKITGFEKIILLENFVDKKNHGEFKKVILDENDPCTIIYTSGTTGNPKGVVLTHKNFLSNSKSITEIIPLKKTDVFLSFLPLSHVLERLAGHFTPLINGVSVAYAENPKELPKNLKEVRPTIIISVPRIFEKFYDAVWDKVNASPYFSKSIFRWAIKQKKGNLNFKIADFLVFKKVCQQMGGRLRLAISGGSSLNENIAKFFSKMGILVLEGYGLTETSPVISVNTENNFKFGSVGKAVPEVEIKISQNKEILVKGPNVFSEYFKDEKSTKEAFDKDGFFCTGDLGFIDKEGFLTIIGRQKEMMATSGGKNIWPEPIENLINNDKFVAQSMVVCASQKFVSALIVPDWQEVKNYFKKNDLPLKDREILIKDPKILEIFQQRLEEKINPKLNDFEKIKKFKLLPDEFSESRGELTPTLKLRRHIIQRNHKKLIDSIYS